MNKLTLSIFALLVVVTTAIGFYYYFDNEANYQSDELLKHNQTLLAKQQALSKLQKQLKISEIDLVANIDEVKKFIDINGSNLTLSKTKKTTRGHEYLLSGKSVDVLVLLYKATQQALKIDINRFLFKAQDQLIVEIVIVGVEK